MTRRYVTVRKPDWPHAGRVLWSRWEWECAACGRVDRVGAHADTLMWADLHARACRSVRAAMEQDAALDVRDEARAAYLAALLVIAKLQRHIADLDAANRRLSDYVDARERAFSGQRAVTP